MPDRLVIVVLAVLLAAAPTRASTFADWISGEWADPKVHVCGEVWIRIEATDDRLTVVTLTFGAEARGGGLQVLDISEDGIARIYNESLGREQQIRWAGPDAHVLETPARAGGVTFVRCHDGPVPDYGE